MTFKFITNVGVKLLIKSNSIISLDFNANAKEIWKSV